MGGNHIWSQNEVLLTGAIGCPAIRDLPQGPKNYRHTCTDGHTYVNKSLFPIQTLLSFNFCYGKKNKGAAIIFFFPLICLCQSKDISNLFWHFWGFTVLRLFSPHILMIFFVWISLSLLSQNQWSFGFVSLHTGLLGHFLCYRTLTTPSWLCPSHCFQKTFCLLSFRSKSPQASWVPWTSQRLPFCHINPELYFSKSDPHYHCKPPSQESGYHNHPLLFLPTISSS